MGVGGGGPGTESSRGVEGEAGGEGVFEEVEEVVSSSHEFGGGAFFTDLVESSERPLKGWFSSTCGQLRSRMDKYCSGG